MEIPGDRLSAEKMISLYKIWEKNYQLLDQYSWNKLQVITVETNRPFKGPIILKHFKERENQKEKLIEYVNSFAYLITAWGSFFFIISIETEKGNIEKANRFRYIYLLAAAIVAICDQMIGNMIQELAADYIEIKDLENFNEEMFYLIVESSNEIIKLTEERNKYIIQKEGTSIESTFLKELRKLSLIKNTETEFNRIYSEEDHQVKINFHRLSNP
jgi:hypothetical protein